MYLAIFLLRVIKEFEAHRFKFLRCLTVFCLYFSSENLDEIPFDGKAPSSKSSGNSILWPPNGETLCWLLGDRVNFILGEYDPGAKKLYLKVLG